MTAYRHWRLAALVLLLGLGAPHLLAAPLPPGAEVTIEGNDAVLDAFSERDGVAVANTQAKVTLAVPAQAKSMLLQWRLSSPASALPAAEADPLGDMMAPAPKGKAGAPTAVLEATWADGKVERLSVTTGSNDWLSDAYFQFPWGLRVHTMPNFEFYLDERRAAVMKSLASQPAASQYWLAIEWRQSPAGTELWADGRLVQDWPGRGPLAKVALSLPKGGALREFRASELSAAPYRPLSLAAWARPVAGLTQVRHSLAPGELRLGELPVRVAGGEALLAVAGLGRLRCPVDDLVSFYWRRGAFDGLPEARIISVPNEPYLAAHLLCAAPPQKDRVNTFTLRLTRYCNGRGDAMADTLVTVPAPETPETPDARRVGTVSYQEGGRQLSAPLWLLRVPLKTGQIQDLRLEDEKPYGFPARLPTPRYLDLEIMDPVAGIAAHEAWPPTLRPTGRSFTPGGPPSAALLFGLTLETAPAALSVRITTPSYAAYAAEAPELRAELSGAAGSYSVAWDLADSEGQVVHTSQQAVTLAAGAPGLATLPLAPLGPGWYAVRCRLLDAAGRELADQRLTCAVLPPDTRRTGFASPHGAWWFHWAHGGAPDLARVGPVYQRAGLRHANLPAVTEDQTKPYELYEWCVKWNAEVLNFPTVAERVAAFEAHVAKSLAAHPSLNKVMFWHESSSNNAPPPAELWGQKPAPMAEADDAVWKARIDNLTAMITMLRAKYPQIKTQFGNTGDSCAIVGELLRRGFRKDFVDFVAVEDLGQTFIPERPLPGAMQSAWLLRETARVLGYPDARITGCYEWLGRRDGVLGLRGQAEWYVRDGLQARAYGFETLKLGVIHDAGKGYYHTLWGSGGLCYRYPYMYPKPAYVALGTLTRLLDGAPAGRVLPTGSHTLLALEFVGHLGPVQALWTPRGKREATLNFAVDATITVTDLYGRERQQQGRTLTLTCGEAATYVTATAPLTGIVAGRASFPDEPPPAQPQVLAPLAELASVSLATEVDKRLERHGGWTLPHRRHGQFDLQAVTDDERGPCLELTLKPEQPITWALQHEYAVIKLAQPVTVAGPVSQVGVWVKGNGGWGDIAWELRNEQGQTWLSTGVYWDWPGKLAINFDGWHYLRLDLGDPWRRGLTVTGLAVTLPRQVLQVTEMAPVRQLSIRLQGLAAH